MKLTRRSQGYRFTKKGWPATKYVDIRVVGRSWVLGIDQNGEAFECERDEMDTDWIKMGGTGKAKGE